MCFGVMHVVEEKAREEDLQLITRWIREDFYSEM